MTRKVFLPAGLLVGSTYLQHVGDQTVENNLDELVMEPTGDWAPNFVGSKSWLPEISLTTWDIAVALGLMTTKSICRNCGAETIKVLQRAVREMALQYDHAETEHLVYLLLNNSLLYWEQIQASQNEEATISLRLAAGDNGTNDPLTILDSQSLPALGASNAPFTLGDVYLNEEKLEGLASVSWSQNAEVVKDSANGEAGASLIYVRRVRPVISIESTELEQLAAFEADGQPLDDIEVYFRRRRPNKLNYANNETVHCKLSATGTGRGVAKFRRTSGDPAKASLEIHLRREQEEDLFDFEANVAIP